VGLRLRRRADPAEAFLRAVYDEHGPAMLAHAMRLTGDRGRAEDIVQETLVRAWQNAEALGRDPRPLRPWLFTVVSHLAVDQGRRRRARPTEVALDDGRGLTAPDELDRALESWQLAGLVAALSPEHRSVLVELYFHDRTVQQTAAVLGIPAGTVKSRSFYALRALRLALEEHGWTP
jgi:RNA polymerase sigma-70 factor (ECF subfamily)